MVALLRAAPMTPDADLRRLCEAIKHETWPPPGVIYFGVPIGDFIRLCSPAVVLGLLAERDALAREVERLNDDKHRLNEASLASELAFGVHLAALRAGLRGVRKLIGDSDDLNAVRTRRLVERLDALLGTGEEAMG